MNDLFLFSMNLETLLSTSKRANTLSLAAYQQHNPTQSHTH